MTDKPSATNMSNELAKERNRAAAERTLRACKKPTESV